MISWKEILHPAVSSDSASYGACYGHRVIAVSDHLCGCLSAAEYAQKERQPYTQIKTP
ncbi:hypothetical protein [Blautia luti]|uniref:hypothetical protein n=1 Tax=Blautia luti TaxID=89014 RepID=UPI0018A9EBDC|nr:hypothetical protein [Blautia luti]